jgi:hypothetical protein
LTIPNLGGVLLTAWNLAIIGLGKKTEHGDDHHRQSESHGITSVK